jgi:hypothetical protein
MRTFFLVVALAGWARAQEADFSGARVAADRGRVILVQEGEATLIVRPGRTIGVHAAAHLEVGAAAQACVSWPGVASLRLTGPVALEWGLSTTPENEAGAGEAALEVSVLELGRIEIELRAGRARLALPGGYVSWFGTGAFRIEGTARGGFDIENRAGNAVKIGRELAHQRVAPAVWLEPGARAPLDSKEVPPRTPDRTAQAPPWPEVEWPFGIPAQGPAEIAPVPAETPALTPPAAEPPVLAPASAEPEPKTVEVTEPIPIAPESPPPALREFLSVEWRGLARAALAPHGAVVIQLHPALAVKPLDGGRLDVGLARDATAPAWILGPKADIELQPGARVFFDAHGALTAHIGSIHVTDLSAPRPRWAELAPEE